jgi:hypothetical protein
MRTPGAFEDLKRGVVVDFGPAQGPDGRPRGVDVVILERPGDRR